MRIWAANFVLSGLAHEPGLFSDERHCCDLIIVVVERAGDAEANCV